MPWVLWNDVFFLCILFGVHQFNGMCYCQIKWEYVFLYQEWDVQEFTKKVWVRFGGSEKSIQWHEKSEKLFVDHRCIDLVLIIIVRDLRQWRYAWSWSFRQQLSQSFTRFKTAHSKLELIKFFLFNLKFIVLNCTAEKLLVLQVNDRMDDG